MDQKYFFSPLEVMALLIEKGIHNLYHANTLATSLSFINNGALMSRHFIEENNLKQTPQKSDKKDKEYGVWDDVFLDAIDLHKKYKTANKYGPILFVIDLKFLESSSLEGVLITKRNPWHWNDNDSWDSRYYSDLGEVEKDYLTGQRLDSQMMFTFRSIGKALSIKDYISAIGIDRPNIIVNTKDENQINVGDFAMKKLQSSLIENGLNIPLVFRHSTNKKYCSCYVDYVSLCNNDFIEFKKLFTACPE